MGRGDVSDKEWAIIGLLLPSERGRKTRPAHERFGKWNSVYVRFRRWAEQGVCDAMLGTLVDLGLTDDW